MNEELLQLFKAYPSLTQEEVMAIASNITVRNYNRGDVLLKEGEISKECFFVLTGCVRQYSIVDGEEKTTAFYTAGEAVASYSSYMNQTPSKHYLMCEDESSLTVGNKDKEIEMCRKFPKLESIIRNEMEISSGKVQEQFSSYMTSSPEERYLHMLASRPTLFNIVAQHKIASYLGVTPESMSRIRKRVQSKLS